MRTVEFIDYAMTLSTGEEITVSELDSGLWPPLADDVVLSLAADVVSRCTVAPREAVEDAKSGYPEALEAFLSTPPTGCLLKLERKACAERKFCAIASARCLTSYFERGRPAFPACWAAEVPDGGTPEQSSAARALSDSVVDAWRDGRHVVLVRG